jgi:mannose-6-phosphate isomerase-like protein (cupin superfamily)
MHDEREAGRLLIAGVNESGHSCAVQEVPISSVLAETAGFRHGVLYTAPSSPPPARPAGKAPHLNVGLSAGVAQWTIIEYGPDQPYPMHHTDTVDFDIVLQGSIRLELDDGSHPLSAGDCVLILGVDHGWRSGPEGCRLSVAFIATPAP